MADIGYEPRPLPLDMVERADPRPRRRALWRMLVGIFCMMQVMMFAVPRYIGGDAIPPDLQKLMIWAEAMLTIPALLFAAGPFFTAAWRDTRQGRIGMDTPVALGIAITVITNSKKRVESLDVRTGRAQAGDAVADAVEAGTAVVVASWGALLLMGVTDPRGGIQTLYPLFGIANQLIAAVALLVVTVMVVRKGYTKWVWIPAIPLVFDTAVTFTASWQKIFSTDPLVGYFQQHREAVAKLGTLTDPAKIEETRAIVRNTMIQGTLSIIFLVMVAFVMVCALIRIVQTIRNRDTTTSEDPYQESNFYAPETMIASSLMKKVSREYEQVGDPALIPHKAHAEKS